MGAGNRAYGAAAAAAVTGPEQLQEIIVTATRRSETALEAPIAFSVYSGKELQTYGVVSLQDLNKLDASIQVTNFGSSQQQIVIRGISSSIAATTGLYLDESPLQGGFQNNFRGDGTPGVRLIDVERVEVLKGPQGTLFGSGSMDGTLRVISNKPELSRIGGSLTAEAATVSNGTGYFDGNLVVNLPIISDTLAVRLVGWGEAGGGYVDQTINGRTINNINNVNLHGARATVLWQATKDFSLTASVNYQNSGANGAQYWDLPLGPYNNNETSLSPYHDDYTLWNLTARYDLHFGEVLAIGTHGRKRTQQPFDSTPTNCSFGLCPPLVPTLSFVPVLDFDDTTAELRFASKFDGPVQLVVGGYYEKDRSVFQGSAVYDNPNGYVGCYTVPDCEAKGLRNPGNNFGGVPSNFLEFGTIDTTDIDSFVEAIAANGADAVALPTRQPKSSWYWTKFHERVYSYQEICGSLNCISVFSARAVQLLLARRRAHTIEHNAGRLRFVRLEPECVRQQLVGAPPDRMIVRDRDDDHLVGHVLGRQLLDPGSDLLGRSDDRPPSRLRPARHPASPGRAGRESSGC